MMFAILGSKGSMPYPHRYLWFQNVASMAKLASVEGDPEFQSLLRVLSSNPTKNKVVVIMTHCHREFLL